MGRVQIVRGVGLLEVVRRFLFLGESPLPNCNWCMGRVQIVCGVGLLEDVRRFLFLGESPPTDCNRCMGGAKIVRGVGLLGTPGIFVLGIVGVGVPDDPVMRSIT